MFQRWSAWIIFPFEGHIADQTRAAFHLILPQKCCLNFCWATVFFFQEASKQSIYKKFWLLFFHVPFLHQEGSMIDPWLELLCYSEPTKSTCPSKTILSYFLVDFCLFFVPTEPADFAALLDVGAAPVHWFYYNFQRGNCPLFGLWIPVTEELWS